MLCHSKQPDGQLVQLQGERVHWRDEERERGRDSMREKERVRERVRERERERERTEDENINQCEVLNSRKLKYFVSTI